MQNIASNVFFILGANILPLKMEFFVVFCFLKTLFVLCNQKSDFQSSFYALLQQQLLCSLVLDICPV